MESNWIYKSASAFICSPSNNKTQFGIDISGDNILRHTDTNRAIGVILKIKNTNWKSLAEKMNDENWNPFDDAVPSYPYTFIFCHKNDEYECRKRQTEKGNVVLDKRRCTGKALWSAYRIVCH